MDPLITLLVGHRGVGKSSFLAKLKEYARLHELPDQFLDLDDEIERHHGRTVGHILSAEGEVQFREVERQTLQRLVADVKVPLVIAVGAGFEGPVPAGAYVIWLRRETDEAGRSFLNRPRLNPAVSPLEEYSERFATRQARFQSWAHDQLFLPEGYVSGLEEFVLKKDAIKVPYDMTVMPEAFRDLQGFARRRVQWNVRRWELRDDLLTDRQMHDAVNALPWDRVLISHRKPKLLYDGLYDWALELGAPESRVDILSLHARRGPLTEAFAALEAHNERANVFKLAVPVHSFEELKQGHDWWRADQKRRAFLPRSDDGRWRWYRQLFGPRMPIHFFRESEGSAPDQPLLWQIHLQPVMQFTFAAVLGHPVGHSRTPAEHFEFFRDLGMPVVAIDINEEEFPQAFPILQGMGLTHAAVTAPLKKAAFAVCTEKTPEAENLQSVNTLEINGEAVRGHNTDYLALQEIKNELHGSKYVWLWGGGGVLTSVQSVWPEAVHIQAREGTTNPSSPDLLIWAVGRGREFKWPPPSCRPKLVLDLNYSDDSPGLEWAVRENLPYQSGLKMFKLQAEFQRRFWRGAKS